MIRKDTAQKISLLRDPKFSEYELVRQIIQARTQQGISQKELADRVGTKQGNISRLESCDYNPSINFLKKIAEALDMELCVSLKAKGIVYSVATEEPPLFLDGEEPNYQK
jgi:transcriptional regulator with XRE-family HTH domain